MVALAVYLCAIALQDKCSFVSHISFTPLLGDEPDCTMLGSKLEDKRGNDATEFSCFLPRNEKRATLNIPHELSELNCQTILNPQPVILNRRYGKRRHIS
jgi:hypothetical protein